MVETTYLITLRKAIIPNITLAPNNITNQASNFNTPPPVKRIAEPISNEKPWKMRKSSQRTNSENNNPENTEDLNKTFKKQINREIVILKNIELLNNIWNQKKTYLGYSFRNT